MATGRRRLRNRGLTIGFFKMVAEVSGLLCMTACLSGRAWTLEAAMATEDMLYFRFITHPPLDG